MKKFLKITGISFVTGKDENGNDLALTRATFEKFSQDESGNLSPDGQDTGSELFVGSITDQKLVDAVSANNLAEDAITTFIAEGVEAK